MFGISTPHFGIFKMNISGASYSWAGSFSKNTCSSKDPALVFFLLLGSLFPLVFLFLLSFLVVFSRVDQASIMAESYCYSGLVTETEYMINVWHWAPHTAGNWSLPYILYMLLLNMWLLLMFQLPLCLHISFVGLGFLFFLFLIWFWIWSL